MVFYDSKSKFVGEHLKKAHIQQEHGVRRMEEDTTEDVATEMQMHSSPKSRAAAAAQGDDQEPHAPGGASASGGLRANHAGSTSHNEAVRGRALPLLDHTIKGRAKFRTG